MFVKNADNISHTWCGQEIQPGVYYQIEEIELKNWQTNSLFLMAMSDGLAIISSTGDQSGDILDYAQALNYLLGTGPIEVKPEASQLTPDGKIQKVAIYKAEGSSATKVTHDFTDPCTWYSKAILVSDKALTLDSGSIYSCGDVNLIDAVHGRIYGEDELTTNGQHWKVNLGQGQPDGRIYRVKVYDNGVLLTEDTNYTINYEQGKFDFTGYTINGALTATYYKATAPTFILAPTPGKILIIEHAELQLSIDCDMSHPINFEVWVYHPNQAQYPGLKIPYQMISYNNIKDIINACNEGTGTFPAMSGLQNEVVVLPFKYATVKPFRSSLGAELRITMNNNLPISGEWGTATFYILSQNE